MTGLDTKFFKPFVDGALKTLKVQCFTDATQGAPFLKGSRAQPEFELAGVIGITSEAFNGTITLCFPKSVFLSIMSNMLGEKFETINEELESGAAELLNIIFGNAKSVLNEQGYAIQKAIPAVVRGSALRTVHFGSTPATVLPFKTSVGEFHIEISTENRSLA